MEATLPLVLSAGWAAGVNSYATVALLCVAGRADLLEVPGAFERTDVLVVAIAMFLVEFVADKVPWFDSLWDTVHTFIRPFVGGMTGTLLAGEQEVSQGLQALAGGGAGTMALASHAVKAGTRLAINASPEPFTNVAMSLVEDLAVSGVVLLATEEPWIALGVAVTLLVTGGTLLVVLAQRVRRGLDRVRSKAARGRSPGRFL